MNIRIFLLNYALIKSTNKLPNSIAKSIQKKLGIDFFLEYDIIIDGVFNEFFKYQVKIFTYW